MIPADPNMLMLGYGWFPDRLGGLNRYYRDLLEQLPDARGVVVGSDAEVPERVAAVSRHDRPLPSRLLAVWRAAGRAAAHADVVDTHFALYALLPLWFGRLRNKPVLLHFHGPWADESLAVGDASRARRMARRLLERAVYMRADQAIVLTSAFRQVLVERYGVQPWVVNVEPPGVDLQRFSPGSQQLEREQLGLAPDEFVAVSVRRLVPRMGLELLLEAWRDALPELPARSTLLVVGEGPLMPRLQDSARRYGIGSSVRFTGKVSDGDLVSHYRAADIAVVPTLEHEGFGLVALEAAACGTPSVVTDVGGLPEAIAPLDPSLIVPAGDAGALRTRLTSAVTERPGPDACRAHAERHGWRSVAQRHRQIARRAASASEQKDGRLKVVYLDHVARMSGGEIALLRLLPHLSRVNPHVVLAEHGPLVGALHREGCSTEVVPFNSKALNLNRAELQRAVPAAVAGATAKYVLRLAARLRRLHPDLVHANSLKAGVYGSLAARLAGIPMIWHVRDRIARDYMPAAAVTLIRAMSGHLPAAVIANSHSTLATLGEPRGSSSRYAVIPDTLGNVPSRQRANGRPLTYGVVGRLAPWKGQDLFLRAFAQAFPGGEQRAVLIGGALFGEDEYADGLRRLAAELGLDNRVEFRGHRSDVWDELTRIDVMVHSSITPEPFGQVILEGMAAEVPVIAANAGGPAEIISHDHTGVLYQPRDVASLADGMLRLQDHGLRQRLTLTAKQALEAYSSSTVAAEMQRVYDDVLAARG